MSRAEWGEIQVAHDDDGVVDWGHDVNREASWMW